jgi:hypothetical protein
LGLLARQGCNSRAFHAKTVQDLVFAGLHNEVEWLARRESLAF